MISTTKNEQETDTRYPNGRYPCRGEIYYISSGNTGNTGSEQQSNRYGVIVSADFVNRTSATVQIVYLTTKPKPNYPTYVDISLPWIHREAICGQIMAVDKSRLVQYKAYLSSYEIHRINTALQIGLGFNKNSVHCNIQNNFRKGVNRHEQ